MILTEDYTFRLDDDGITLNDDVNSQFFVDILRVDGLDSPAFRETVRDHEGQDGGFLDAEYERAREISLEGIIYGNTTQLESNLDKLKANWAPRTNPIPLYIYTPGVQERIVFVKPRGVRYSWEAIRRTGQINVKFGAYAEDPRIYGTDLLTVNINVGESTSDGFGFPLGFPFGFGSIPASLPTNVRNLGNRPTPSIMRIYGPTINPRIINDTSNLTMTFAINFDVNNYLEIDTKNRTVKLNGSTNRRNSLVQPDWFDLKPGNNFIRYQSNTGEAPSYLSISYRDAWR